MPNNSLKHIHSLNGNILWREFCQKHNIPILNCGKYIVAKNDQLDQFNKLFKNANENQVPNVQLVSTDKIKKLNEIRQR